MQQLDFNLEPGKDYLAAMGVFIVVVLKICLITVPFSLDGSLSICIIIWCKFLTVLTICILFFTHIIGATANCPGWECEFTNSNHYKYAKTYCAKTLNFEEVETDFLHFTI